MSKFEMRNKSQSTNDIVTEFFDPLDLMDKAEEFFGFARGDFLPENLDWDYMPNKKEIDDINKTHLKAMERVHAYHHVANSWAATSRLIDV